MSKVYEALKKADEEREQRTAPTPSPGEPRSGQEPARREALSQSVEHLIPIQEKTAEPEEAILPEDIGQGAIDNRLVTFTDPQSVAAEQFRKIRTVLSQARMVKGYKAIMVTSALAQEGKTLASANLGITITQGLDDKAFLIDCDLRRPQIHHLFGFNGRPGLADVLLDKKELPQVVHEVEGLGLKVIPAGKSPENPAELLSSEKMVNFLEELKANYEDHYIILDTTPILLTAEAGILSRTVDGIILMIMGGKTSRDLVKSATKEIPQEKIIGVVLNNAQSKEGYHSRYYLEYSHPYASRKHRR